jgi:hypothetical protein
MKFAGDVLDSEVVVLQSGEPSSHPPVYLSGILPEGKVCMVCEYGDWGFRGG